MPSKPSKKLGKLSLTLLEHFVKSNLGEDFVKELRGTYDLRELLKDALSKVEQRFLKEFPDKDLSRAMFVDLSQQDRPELTQAIEQFYQHPSDPGFQEVLQKTLLGEFSSLGEERVEKAVGFYLKLLIEELAMLDDDFRSKVSFLIDFRRETQEKSRKDRKKVVAQKQPKGFFQVPPLPPQGVYGRNDDLQKIAQALAVAKADTDVPPIALRGMGGIGKTTLALALAHSPEIQSIFQDGILWTSLGPKPTARLLLEGWGRSLGIDLQPERDESACQQRLRQFLHDKKVLVIVDDVWDIKQGSYFQIGGPRSRTVFTTRELPIANALATRERTLRVEVIKPEFALELLYKLAPETAGVDRNIAMRLCERLEFLPLALTLAGRMLANESDVPQRMQRLLGELIERREARLQLLQAEGRPGLDEENPVSIQAILGMSVERLDQADQERFAMLSVFGGEPLTWEIRAVSATWDCDEAEAEATIARFIHRGLVEPHGKRYWMHALLADYAAEMMAKMGL